MSDLPEALRLPPFQEIIARQAPRLSIQSYYTPRHDVIRKLGSGALDLAIEVPLIDDTQLCHQALITERFVCMVRKDHPLCGNKLSMEDYIDLKHIHISSRKKGLGHIDTALNALGLKRNIQLRLQHYMIAPLIAMRTDLALTIPLSLARQHDARILDLPFDIPNLEWHLYWHKSADQDQANQWLRNQLFQLTGQVESAN